MSDNSNIYLNDPDPLSILLQKLSLTAEVYVSGDFCGAWAVDTSGSRRIPFHLIGKGQAWLHFEGTKTQLKENDLVIFPNDHTHIISNSERKPSKSSVNKPMSNQGDTVHMVCGFFQFKTDMVNPLLDALPNVILLSPETSSGSNKAHQYIELILLELSESKSGNYAVVDQLAYLLFIEVLRLQVENNHLESGLLVALFDSRIGKAISAIIQHPQENWTLVDLANIAAMSRSNFVDVFKQLLNVSPIKYLTYWRINEAKKLLQTTELNLAQIADKTGYETEAAFGKAFKRLQNQSPGEYRKRNCC